jgi:hypothetical protein
VLILLSCVAAEVATLFQPIAFQYLGKIHATSCRELEILYSLDAFRKGFHAGREVSGLRLYSFKIGSEDQLAVRSPVCFGGKNTINY